MADFVTGYHHHHSGIGLHTPAEVHYGPAAAAATARSLVLGAARARNPEPFGTAQDPQILAIPNTAWINKPADNTGIELGRVSYVRSQVRMAARMTAPR